MPRSRLALFFVAYVAVAALSLPGAAIMTLIGGGLFGLTWGTLVVSFALLGLFPFVARRALAGHIRPRRFDRNLVVIGAGSAGLVTAYITAAVKASVSLAAGAWKRAHTSERSLRWLERFQGWMRG